MVAIEAARYTDRQNARRVSMVAGVVQRTYRPTARRGRAPPVQKVTANYANGVLFGYRHRIETSCASPVTRTCIEIRPVRCERKAHAEPDRRGNRSADGVRLTSTERAYDSGKWRSAWDAAAHVSDHPRIAVSPVVRGRMVH